MIAYGGINSVGEGHFKNSFTGRRKRIMLHVNRKRGWAGICKQGIPRTLCVLTAIAAIGVTQTQAEVMEYSNDAGFVWYGGTGGAPIGLDVTKDAGSQTGAYGGIGQFHQATELPFNDTVSGGAGGGQLQVGGLSDAYLVGVDAGIEIPGGIPWRTSGKIYHPTNGTWLPDEPTYLGIQFPMGDGTHYGWIYVDKFVAEGGEHCLDALTWAYETEPNKSIWTPEPGSLALLAFGAVSLIRRRS
jgi:hypothetical protein